MYFMWVFMYFFDKIHKKGIKKCEKVGATNRDTT